MAGQTTRPVTFSFRVVLSRAGGPDYLWFRAAGLAQRGFSWSKGRNARATGF